MKASAAEVLLGTAVAGRLTNDERRRGTFVFADSYLMLADRAVLGQHFEDDLTRKYRGKSGELPPYFANLLPEGSLREILESRLEVETGDDLSLLVAVGHDLPGRTVVRALDNGDTDIEVSGTDEEASPPSPRPEHDGFRFSLAGLQLKFSMLREHARLTFPGRNETGSWIVKVASPTWAGLCENEYSVLEWARAAGFDVPECDLVPVSALVDMPSEYVAGTTHAFAIRRFDREEHARIHQEDFAQVVGLAPRNKYEHLSYADIGKLCMAFIGEHAFEEVLRRVVFVLASGNNDAHLKNWSLVYPDGMAARLSPLYDQVATVAWQRPDRKLALRLVHKKHFGEIDADEIRAFGVRCDVSAARAMEIANRAMDDIAAAWERVSDELPILAEHKTSLRAHWANVPLLRSGGLHRLAVTAKVGRRRLLPRR